MALFRTDDYVGCAMLENVTPPMISIFPQRQFLVAAGKGAAAVIAFLAV
jgi:hypothetical protein